MSVNAKEVEVNAKEVEGNAMAAEREVHAQDAQVPEEQLVYANLLYYGSLMAIGLMVLGFVLYVTGILNPAVPVDMIPSVWDLDVREYVEAVNVPTGWAWLAYLGQGDYFNYLGIALLAGLTIVGYVILLPGYIKRKDLAYSLIIAAEIAVLVLAASGILAGGH